jgi:hypothetical protein
LSTASKLVKISKIESKRVLWYKLSVEFYEENQIQGGCLAKIAGFDCSENIAVKARDTAVAANYRTASSSQSNTIPRYKFTMVLWPAALNSNKTATYQ